MLFKVRDTILRHSMLSGSEVVVVAVSGGIDSVVLLHLLTRLAGEYSLTLVVTHLNHNLRAEESRRDYDFVRALARRLGLKFAGKTLRPGELKKAGRSLQEAARARRYAFLDEVAERYGAARIALGHNADDQAETVLMRLLKGSSLSGLAGIPAVRGRLIRPLIDASRTEIERYAKAEGLDHVEDSSNRKDDYLRNDIRHNLIGYLKKNYNPNIVETLARTATVLRADDEYIETVSRAAAEEAVVEKSEFVVVLDISRLASMHEALSSRVLLAAAEILGKRSEISSTHIKSFIWIVKSANPSAEADLPGLKLTREYERLVVSPPRERKPVSFEVRLKVPGTTVVPGGGFVFKATRLKKVPAEFSSGQYAEYFDLDAIAEPITVRQFAPGDRMVPLGMKGAKKLKEIFIERKVPRALRPLVPVLCTSDGILWAAGVRRSELARVTEETVRVLKVEFRQV